MRGGIDGCCPHAKATKVTGVLDKKLLLTSDQAMAGATAVSNSSAIGPAAGYFYQLRYGLLRALEVFPKNPTSIISIETLDDVSIAGEHLAIDSQLKHSVDPSKKISKFHPAIWRTLAIWLFRLRQGVHEHHEFHFITTAEIDGENPLHYLRPTPTDLDVNAALGGLEEAAKNSSNSASANDRSTFLNASDGERLSLIRRVRLADATPNLEAIASDIEQHIRYACEAEQVVAFRRDLEGWWIGRVFDKWVADGGAQIELEELGAQVSFLKERYEPSELPLDVPEQDCEDLMEGNIFIKQIRAVTESERRIRNAQKAFLRAKVQRSKWVREHRIDPTELNIFDDELRDRWEAHHAGECDSLLPESTPDDKAHVGKSVLQWAETSAVPIRSTRSVYLTSGSYHALADALEVGWHPDFSDLFGADK